MEGVFMPRPIDTLVVLGVWQSSQSWAAMMARNPAFKGEVWTLNSGILAFRHDVGWDMHTEEYIHSRDEKTVARVLSRQKFYETHNKPIVMPKAYERFPTSVAFPLAKVVAITKSDYFHNGMAYMLAMALLCEVKTLYLIGSDWIVEHPDGRSFMENGRACVEYWLGRIAQTGCDVIVTHKSPVLMANERAGNHTIYGYHEPVQAVNAPDGSQRVMVPDYVNQ